MTDGSWPFLDTPSALSVLAAYLRGEAVDKRTFRHALETLLEAWDTAEGHASHCYRKLGRRGPRGMPSGQDLQALVEAVVRWHGHLAHEPMELDLANAAQYELDTLRFRP